MNHNTTLGKKIPGLHDLLDLSFKNRRSIIGLGLLALAVVLLYLEAFDWLLDQWLTDRVYSHGFIVPLISLYLVWVKREQLADIEPRPNYLAGSLVLLISGILLVVGRVGAVIQVESFSFLLMLPGVVLFLRGWSHLKALALPIFYLQFMVPWMDVFLERIQWTFQLLSAQIGSWLLEVMGYSVFHNRILIQLPDLTMEVARACSGINFLISVIAIGLPLVYLTQMTWLRGAGVVVAGCIITVLANGARVAIAGILGSHYGAEMLHGPGHIFRGWFVAQMGWVGLFLVNWAVLKLPCRYEYRLYERWKESRTARKEASPLSVSARPMAIVLMFLFGLGIYMHGFAMPHDIPLKRGLTAFPYRIGSWNGSESKWMKGEDFFPNADSQLMRTYRNPSGGEIHLYICYFESQGWEKRLISFHDKPLFKGVKVFATELDSVRPQTVNRSFLIIDLTRYEIAFWYRFPSGDLTGRRDTKLKTIFDALIHRRNNGAVIVLAKPLHYRSEEASVSGELKDFLRVVAPALPEYLP